MRSQSQTIAIDSPIAIPAGTVRDFFSLLKPRVMSLVVFTGLVGLLLAPGTIHPLIACVAVGCIALGSGAAGAINMWYDRDIDAIMRRTATRPVPAGRVNPESALEFGIVLATISVLLMAVAVNLAAAALLLGAILFYTHVYTMWLKRTTPQNIVIGGAAGAFPPVIGWVAVTGDFSLEPWLLFAIIFFWTPPHFWALSLCGAEDYKRANIPMLPVTHGMEYTKLNILLYTVVLVMVTLLPFAAEVAGYLYLFSAFLLNAFLIKHALTVYQGTERKQYMGMFKYTVLYLFLLFLMLVVDQWVTQYALS
ncbi:MAG: protoheme IX farnesyltransferase [Hyphomicrobiales bacterium]|nr:protoheme IX farnesyltransferase [Hyphomicrobiales bacterium]